MISFCWQEMLAYALLHAVVCVAHFLHNLWISLGYYFYHYLIIIIIIIIVAFIKLSNGAQLGLGSCLFLLCAC